MSAASSVAARSNDSSDLLGEPLHRVNLLIHAVHRGCGGFVERGKRFSPGALGVAGLNDGFHVYYIDLLYSFDLDLVLHALDCCFNSLLRTRDRSSWDSSHSSAYW